MTIKNSKWCIVTEPLASGAFRAARPSTNEVGLHWSPNSTRPESNEGRWSPPGPCRAGAGARAIPRVPRPARVPRERSLAAAFPLAWMIQRCMSGYMIQRFTRARARPLGCGYWDLDLGIWASKVSSSPWAKSPPRRSTAPALQELSFRRSGALSQHYYYCHRNTCSPPPAPSGPSPPSVLTSCCCAWREDVFRSFCASFSREFRLGSGVAFVSRSLRGFSRA